jgi:hypothetical protein
MNNVALAWGEKSYVRGLKEATMPNPVPFQVQHFLPNV